MLLPGTRIGAYEVIAKLGEGGMGEVYRARDTRLDREVALKLLPSDMETDATRLERFAREARALAALTHPNIVTIYSTEDADGIRFLTMELIEGKPLDQMIPKSGFAIAPLLDIAIPLCDAIAAAHDKHLTHRDLKPANVMVAGDGRVKVLDFGLASFTRPEREHADVTRMELTHRGTVLGTAPYMSPEQVEGKALDHRTDIFSLGIMLYEMATGTRPFHGDSSPALMSSILKDTPPALRDLRPEIPGELGRLIARCLEKDQRDRVQTARDVFNELKLLRRDITSGTAARSAPAPTTRSRYPLVAVAPFDARGAGDEAQILAEGLGEDIAAGLSRFSHIRVGARADARYLVEGTVRKAGTSVRVTTRLVDAASGVHLWAETFDRTANEDLFALQDDLTSRIVSTVADPYGVLVRSMAATLTGRPYDELTANELVLRYYVYLDQFRLEEHARLRDAFEQAVARAPGDADAWAALSRLYEHEHSHGANPRPNALERARHAAMRAIEFNPLSQLAWEALTSVHFFARDRAALRAACERTIALNPLNAGALAWVAMALTWSGDWDRGDELIRRVMTYNAHHAGWFHFITVARLFHLRRFEDALAEAKRVNMPHFQWMHFDLATAAGHVGRRGDAQAALDELRRINPDMLNPECARRATAAWIWDDEETEVRIDGLRKALALVDAAPAVATAPASRLSSSRSDVAPPATKFATAVLPFTSPAGDTQGHEIAEALRDEVTRGLARFFYLSVVTDAAAARYHISATIRRAGGSLRVGAQLVDTSTGAHLWAETYTRALSDDALVVVDEVTDKIVATVADVCGALVRSMVQTIRHVPLDELSPFALLLRHWGFEHRPTPDEHAALRAATEKCLDANPAHRGLWAQLSHLYSAEFGLFFNPLPDPLGRAVRAARREIDLDRTTELGWEVLALASFYARDRNTFFPAAEQALSLNPRNANTTAWMGNLLTHAGEFDRGVEITARAKTLNPQHPGWYHFAAFTRHVKRREFDDALSAARRANMPDFLWMYFAIAAAAGQLQRADEARVAYGAMVELAPLFTDPAMLREFVNRWYWDDEVIDTIWRGIGFARDAAANRPASGITGS